MSEELKPFQARVDTWMDACFGDAIKADRLERCDRFIEEALELCQTEDTFTAERAHALVDYVFNRSQGEINQEVGGVMVTLAALCNTRGVDIEAAQETELARVWTKVEQIRAKQAAKPTGSALPFAALRRPEPDVEGVARAIMNFRSAMQPDLQWAIESEDQREWYRGLARAAIAAMGGGDGD